MGWEPDEMETPLDITDLSYEAQLALFLFNVLPDKIEGMSGIWLGKDFSGLGDIMSIYGVEKNRDAFDLLQICIAESSKHYEAQRKLNEAKNKVR